MPTAAASVTDFNAQALALALSRLTVVVVTHHSAHCIPALARSLAAFRHVIVVDNASHDTTAELVQKHMPNAVWVSLQVNVGFGTANNQALDRVATPYALLINPDCLITPEAAAQLVTTADNQPNASVVAPQLQDNGGRPQLNYGWPRWKWPSRGPGAEGVTCVGYACAAAWLLRCDERKWRFDSDFFLYYEDEDLCARIIAARQEVLIDPAAVAQHANRGSVKGRSVVRTEWGRGYHHSRSKLLFMRKHHGGGVAQRTRQQALWRGGLELLLRLLTLQPRLIARSAGRWAGMWSVHA
jgi:N-acetylglucosaminyl-diphospho-decaprenol L-rhamnosyltransferase